MLHSRDISKESDVIKSFSVFCHDAWPVERQRYKYPMVRSVPRIVGHGFGPVMCAEGMANVKGISDGSVYG